MRGAVGNEVAKAGSSQFSAIPESQARGLDCTEREPRGFGKEGQIKVDSVHLELTMVGPGGSTMMKIRS